MIDAFLLLNLETLVLQILVVVQQVLPHLNQFGPEPLIQLILASLLLPWYGSRPFAWLMMIGDP